MKRDVLAMTLVAMVAFAGLGFFFASTHSGAITAMDSPEYVGNPDCIAAYHVGRAACLEMRYAPARPGCFRIAMSDYVICDYMAQKERPPARGPTAAAQQACDRTYLIQIQSCPQYPLFGNIECRDRVQQIHFKCIGRILGTLYLAEVGTYEEIQRRIFTPEVPVPKEIILQITPTAECNDIGCFREKFTTCQDVEVSETLLGITYQYVIKGTMGDYCTVDTKFIEHPDPQWVKKKMTCLYNNSKSWVDASKEVLDSFSADQPLGDCTGDLYVKYRTLFTEEG